MMQKKIGSSQKKVLGTSRVKGPGSSLEDPGSCILIESLALSVRSWFPGLHKVLGPVSLKGPGSIFSGMTVKMVAFTLI